MHDTDDRDRPNIDAVGWPRDSYSDDLGHGLDPVDRRGGGRWNRELHDHERLPGELDGMTDEERDRLFVLVEGTHLENGATYLDLDRLAQGPFSGRDGEVVESGRRIVSQRAVDDMLWDRLEGAARTARARERG
jgi:hypothetical protein